MMSESNLKKKAGAMKDNPLAGHSPAKRTNNHDMKDLGMLEDLKGKGKKPDIDKLNSSGLGAENFEDSFQKLYSKELDLDEDEVPIILHELNDSAIHFISREQFERSLSLLQKAQTLLDRLQFQKNPNDRFLVQVTMHNMALCFQKMGALEECALCLDACLHQLNSQYLLPKFQGSPTKKLKKLKYECKIHMQVCALLSQLHRHSEALCHAKRAVQISQYLVRDLQGLCKVNYEKSCEAKIREQVVHEEIEKKRDEEKKKKKKDHKGAPDTYLSSLSRDDSSSKLDLIYYEHSVSMLERTAYRVYPIIKEVAARMVPEKDVEKPDLSQKSSVQTPASADQHALNMKVLLGYLNQSEWLFLLNIGNIMQITPLTIHDLYTTMSIDVELARDAVLEKICYLCISYFCVSTELRFLVQTKEKLVINQAQVKQESEFWHAKALEISCSFLPSESPLVSHILSSYQKHHAPVQESIPEDESQDAGVKVIRPIKGIDKCQYQPMVRFNKNLSIALSPLNLSPNNYGAKKPIVTEIERTGVRNQPRLEPQCTADYSSHGVGVQSVQVTQNRDKQPQVDQIKEEIQPKDERLENISSQSEITDQIGSAAPNPLGQNSDSQLEQKDDLNTVQTDMSIQARTKQTFPPQLNAEIEKDLRHVIKNSSEGKDSGPIRNQRPQTGTNRKDSSENSKGFLVQKQTNALSQGGTFKTDESNGDEGAIINSRFQFHSNKVPGESERPKSKHGPPQSAKAGQPASQVSLDGRVQPISKQTITQNSTESVPGSCVEKRSSGSEIMLMNQINQGPVNTNKSLTKVPKQQQQSKFDKREDSNRQKNLAGIQEPKKAVKSTVVSNQGTGRLFENLDESLDPNSVTQNSMEIPNQSSGSSGTRKIQRPSSNHPRDPVNIQVLTKNALDNSVNNLSNRSSSVGRGARRKINDQTSSKASKLVPNYNLNDGSKHSFASNNNVSSTKDLSNNLIGKSDHSRSVLTQQRSQNFLSAKSTRTINQESSRHGDIRLNEIGAHSRDGDLFQDGNQIIDVQTRQKTSQQKTQQNFMVGNQSQSHQSLVKPSSQPAKNGQRGNSNLVKKQSPSQAKGSSSSKQNGVGNYQKQKQFKDMIGLLVMQQQVQKNLPGSKTSVNTPNVHSNQGTANVVNLLQSIPTTSLEIQKQNLVQSVLNHQQNPPSRRKSASSKGKPKQQKMVNDFQTQLGPNNKIGQFAPTLVTSQSQVQFTSAINSQNGVTSSERVSHKVNNNQGISKRIDELMMGVGSGPGGFEFAGKQTKSQTNLQLQKNQQKSIQNLFNQRVSGIEKQHHSRAETGNPSKSKSQDKKQQSNNKQTSNMGQFNSVINSSNNHMSKLNQVYSTANINSNNVQFGSNMPTALIGSKMSSKHLQKLQSQRTGADGRFAGQSSGNGQKKERELTPVFPNQQQQSTQLTRPDQMFPGSLGSGAGTQSQGKFIQQRGQPAVLHANQVVTNEQFNMKSNKHKKHQGAVTAVPVAGVQDSHQRSRMQQPPSSNSAVDIQAQISRPSKTEVTSPNGGRDNMMQQWSRH